MKTEYRAKMLTERIKLIDTTSGGSMGFMEREAVGVRVIYRDDGSIMFTAYKIVGAKCYCQTKTTKGGLFTENSGHENASEEILKDKLYEKYKVD